MADDWRRYLDEAPEPRGVRLMKWHRTFTDEWIEVRRNGVPVIEAVLTGEARIVQVAPGDEDAASWATIASGGQVQDVLAGQDLLLNGALKGRLRFSNDIAVAERMAMTTTKRTTMPARDVVMEAHEKELLEQSRLRLQRGDPTAHDVLRVLADVPTGYYLLQDVHAALCGWSTIASTGRFFLGDLPLFPEACPGAQAAVDALNACETLDERRDVFNSLPPEQRTKLITEYGPGSSQYHLANRRRSNFGNTLRQVHVISNDAKFPGPHRIRVFERDGVKEWPDAVIAWRSALPNYGGRNANVYVVERV